MTPSGLSQIYHRHNVTVFKGAAQPSGDLDNFFSTSFLTGVEYGFRFHQNFQVAAGYEAIFGAAGVKSIVVRPRLAISEFATTKASFLLAGV